MHRKIARKLKETGFALVVASMMLYGGGCSLKSIGAGLLSEFLTTGGVNSLLGTSTTGSSTSTTGDSLLGSALTGLVTQALGSGT